MSGHEKVVAEFSPVKYRVQKLIDSQWILVGDFDNSLKALERARDLAQNYNLKSRVIEVPK